MITNLGEYVFLGTRKCGDNWVTEDAVICVPPPGDTGRHDAPCSRMLQLARQKGKQLLLKCREPGRQAPVSVAKHRVAKFSFYR
jgi:hypothetical protein